MTYSLSFELERARVEMYKQQTAMETRTSQELQEKCKRLEEENWIYRDLITSLHEELKSERTLKQQQLHFSSELQEKCQKLQEKLEIKGAIKKHSCNSL